MSKSAAEDGVRMGDQTPGEVISPLSFQRTDGDSVDSLLEPRPKPASYSPPMDTVGWIPKIKDGKK